MEKLKNIIDELQSAREKQQVELEKSNNELKAQQAKVCELENLQNSEEVDIGKVSFVKFSFRLEKFQSTL